MKSSACLVLLFSSVAISALTEDNWQFFSECDRTVGKGVAVCMQYFSPIQFVRDIIGGNKDSLCCSHFKHSACIRGVRDAVKVAKSANLCSESLSDTVISTLTDSSINSYITTSCKSFNAGKCVMDSVGDVVNTIQGFFVLQQQKPVIPQVIDNIFNRGNTGPYNSNVNNDRTSLFDSFREVKTRVSSTENPLINKSIRDFVDRQYIPEASVLKPISDIFNGNKQTTTTENPLRSLFNGIVGPRNPSNPKTTDEPSIFDSIGNLFNTNDNKSPSILQTFGDIFSANGTNDGLTIVRDIADAVNKN